MEYEDPLTVPEPEPAWKTYAYALSSLGHGTPLWNAHSSKTHPEIRIGDVGYLVSGSFVPLIRIVNTQTEYKADEALPLLEPGVVIQDPSLPPGIISSHNITILSEISNEGDSLELNSPILFESSGPTGAILITRYPTVRENAASLAPFRDWLLSNHTALLAIAHQRDESLTLGDLVLVTGRDITQDHAEYAFSGNTSTTSISFGPIESVDDKTVVNAPPPWGEWHAPPPAAFEADGSSTFTSTAHVSSHSTHADSFQGDAHVPHGECVFVRGFRIFDHTAMKPKNLIPDTASTSSQDTTSTGELDDLHLVPTSATQIQLIREATSVGVGDPLLPLAEYIFEADSAAKFAMVHDLDVSALIHLGRHDEENVDDMIRRLRPSINVDQNGVASLALTRSSTRESSLGSSRSTSIGSSLTPPIFRRSRASTTSLSPSLVQSPTEQYTSTETTVVGEFSTTSASSSTEMEHHLGRSTGSRPSLGVSPSTTSGTSTVVGRRPTQLLSWLTRARPEPAPPSLTMAISPVLPVEDLIRLLTPPAVPSLAHAHALAKSLHTGRSSLRPSILDPILASLCEASDVSLQVAGWEVMTEYWIGIAGGDQNQQQYSRSDRLAHIAMVVEHTLWIPDVWEARYRALNALLAISGGAIGLERELVLCIRSWIEGAFEPLLGIPGSISVEERTERERSIDSLSAFLITLFSRVEIASRLTDDDLSLLLRSFETMVDRSLTAYTNAAKVNNPLSISTNTTSATNTPTRPISHRRHPSSATIPTMSPSIPSFKLPADCIIEAYTKFLTIHQTALPYNSLKTTLPMLFRCLAHYCTPLPVPSVSAEVPLHQAAPQEMVIIGVLSAFIGGTYVSTVIDIIMRCLRPCLEGQGTTSAIHTSIGAFRIVRIYIRRVLRERLARMADLQTEYFADDVEIVDDTDVQRTASARSEPARFGHDIKESVAAWINTPSIGDAHEPVLEEAAGIVTDVLHVHDARDQDSMDSDEASAMGDALMALAQYIPNYRYNLVTPYKVPLAEPKSAPTPFLRTLTTLLARDPASLPLRPSLTTILLSIANNIDDVDLVEVPESLDKQKVLSPTSLEWLDNWGRLLSTPVIFSQNYPRTHEVVVSLLRDLFAFIKDMPEYRKPLSHLVLELTTRQTSNEQEDSDSTLWRILSEEVVMRSAEVDHQPVMYDDEVEVRVDNLDPEVQNILDFFSTVALEKDADVDEINASVMAASSTVATPSLISAYTRPIASRRPSGMPPEHSNSGLTSALIEHTLYPSSRAQNPPSSVQATTSLVHAFAQLVFTPLALNEHFLVVAVRIYRDLIAIVHHAECPRARLCALSFLLRLRADRDHRLYFEAEAYERDVHTRSLASHIGRADPPPSQMHLLTDPPPLRPPQDRESRTYRGRATQTRTRQSRSRSRAPRHLSPSVPEIPVRNASWRLPEYLPFDLSTVRNFSERLTSYDPEGPGRKVVLPLSEYVALISELLQGETDWEVLSYVLCFLPVQLSNKHLFCGPKCREEINRLLNALCKAMKEGFAAQVEHWSPGATPSHANGLAYHTLLVLVGYRRLFKSLQQNVMVELFYLGLSEQPFTARCCLHALSLAAFELRPSMTRYLANILEKLAQIISNPILPVHIINFLAIIGSTPSLHANFTPGNFKQVFVVALRYLQDHNRQGMSPTTSWALSQHVRIMSYAVIYLWFLAVKLPERPQYVSDIVKGLLEANEGNAEVDEPTEVCLDWLARYTYASADPRPAKSILDEVVMEAKDHTSAEVREKTWVMGDSAVITIRALTKLGWVEVLSRRPSGLTKILCRVENIPLVGPGDVDPDMVSLPGVLMMDKDPHSINSDILSEVVNSEAPNDDDPPPPRPNAITGYVWSETAPSQRRKDVAIDPSFFALQLSSYPTKEIAVRGRLVKNRAMFDKFKRTFDYMPVIDTHKVGVLYVAPGQKTEAEILRNTHGSPAYTRFLENLGRLIFLRGQKDVYMGDLIPGIDGDYAYAWWDDIGQTVYHTATLMPNPKDADDPNRDRKKALIGNDFVRIVWNDSGAPYPFDMLKTDFQFVNIVIEPHSVGAVAAFSNNMHEHEYFKLTIQRAPKMVAFTPLGDFKIISAEGLPFFVRQLGLHSDWFAKIFSETNGDTLQREIQTNWRARLGAIRRFSRNVKADYDDEAEIPQSIGEGVLAQLPYRDFTTGL